MIDRTSRKTKGAILTAALATTVAVAAASAVGAAPTAGPSMQAAPAGIAGKTAVDPRSGGLEVALGEWSIGLEAKAIRPGRVTLVITNRGKARHGFEIEAAGKHRERDDDDQELETDRLEPGESARLTLDLEPGVYEIECFVSHHDDRGMVGTLTVRADAPLVSPPKARTNAVAIKNFAFKPALLRAKVGATVRWRNQDPAQHTATAPNGSFDSKLLGSGAGYSRKFTRPGTYAYLCALHPQMTGKVIVQR